MLPTIVQMIAKIDVVKYDVVTPYPSKVEWENKYQPSILKDCIDMHEMSNMPTIEIFTSFLGLKELREAQAMHMELEELGESRFKSLDHL